MGCGTLRGRKDLDLGNHSMATCQLSELTGGVHEGQWRPRLAGHEGPPLQARDTPSGQSAVELGLGRRTPKPALRQPAVSLRGTGALRAAWEGLPWKACVPRVGILEFSLLAAAQGPPGVVLEVDRLRKS